MKLNELNLFKWLREKRLLIIFIILINIILKLPLLLMPFTFGGEKFYIFSGKLLLEGYIPYQDFIKDLNAESIGEMLYSTSSHPNGPLNYYLYTLIIILFGESAFSIKLPIFICEVLTAVLIYKIGKTIKNEKTGFYSAIFYSLSIINFFPIFAGPADEIISGAIVLCSVYFFFKKNIAISSIFLGIAASYKYYSILLIIPIYLYCLRNYSFKDFIKYILVFIGTLVVISLPFLILCPSDFFYWNLSQFSRFMTVSFGESIQETLLFAPLIQLEIITINLLNIIQFSVALISYLILSRRFKDKMSKLDFLLFCAFYISLLPCLTLTINSRYLTWLLPFLIIPIIYEFSHLRSNEFEIVTTLYALFMAISNLIFITLFINDDILSGIFIAFYLISMFIWLFVSFIIFKENMHNIIGIFGIFLHALANIVIFASINNLSQLMPFSAVFIYSSELLVIYFIFKKPRKLDLGE